MSFSVSRDEVILGNYRIGEHRDNGRQDFGLGNLWQSQTRNSYRNGRKGCCEDP